MKISALFPILLKADLATQHSAEIGQIILYRLLWYRVGLILFCYRIRNHQHDWGLLWLYPTLLNQCYERVEC